MRASGRMLDRTLSTLVKKWIIAVSALRPFHDVIWCAGAPLNVYFAPTMFRQHVPNPGAGLVVALDEWLRTRMSMPSKACAACISVFAFGGIISSPGAPNTVTLPGVR